MPMPKMTIKGHGIKIEILAVTAVIKYLLPHVLVDEMLSLLPR